MNKKKKIEKSRNIKKYTNEVTDLNDYNFLLICFKITQTGKKKKG